MTVDCMKFNTTVTLSWRLMQPGIGSVATWEPLVQWPFGWGYQTGGRARFDIRQRGSWHNKFKNAVQPLAVQKLKRVRSNQVRLAD
ncbi:hypothetical protein HZ326_3029 [Fusarium oxysporum f. sp. albedinis]|nr:hypothetical protein HZ326_3029 [Fusarium oxysporum f. sp. albedinis]